MSPEANQGEAEAAASNVGDDTPLPYSGLTLEQAKANINALGIDDLRSLCVSLLIQRRIEEKYVYRAMAAQLADEASASRPDRPGQAR